LAKRKDGLRKKGKEFAFLDIREHVGEMKPSGWPHSLFCEEAAVTVAVHEGKYRRTTVPLSTPSSA
jgi:hypothetical protein